LRRSPFSGSLGDADPVSFYSMVKVGCLASDIQTAATFLVEVVAPILHPKATLLSVQPLLPAG
jgi:hypothetical protein